MSRLPDSKIESAGPIGENWAKYQDVQSVAAVTGAFALIATEINKVISALTSNGIQVTALHSHMLTEQPRLFFMHFLANDDAAKICKGLHAALDQTTSAK